MEPKIVNLNLTEQELAFIFSCLSNATISAKDAKFLVDLQQKLIEIAKSADTKSE